MVTLLTGRYRDAKPILRRRQRTRRISSECTRRVHQSIEIEPDFTGLAYAMVRNFGIQKTSRAICRRFAGGVTHNKEKVGRFRIFEHGLEPENFSIESEFRDAGRRHVG